MPVILPPDMLPGETLEDYEKRIRALELGSGTASGTNADTVDGIHAAATPTANYLLALDASSQFPTASLKATKGTASFVAGNSVYVSAGVVSSSTRIFIMPTSTNSGIDLWIAEKNQGTSFRVSADVSNSMSFDYMLWN